MRAGEVGLAVADVVGGGVDGDDDGAVGVGGAAGSGVVGEEILGAEFAVDAVEDGAEFLGRVGVEHGAAGGVGHGFEGVLAGGVAAALVFHRADDENLGTRRTTANSKAPHVKPTCGPPATPPAARPGCCDMVVHAKAALMV